jgi:hypothetical protein
MYPHELRHGYATHCLQNGVNPRAIQQAMGHASLETTMDYLHAESLSVRSPLETVLGSHPLAPHMADIAIPTQQQATARAPPARQKCISTFALNCSNTGIPSEPPGWNPFKVYFCHLKQACIIIRIRRRDTGKLPASVRQSQAIPKILLAITE